MLQVEALPRRCRRTGNTRWLGRQAAALRCWCWALIDSEVKRAETRRLELAGRHIGCTQRDRVPSAGDLDHAHLRSRITCRSVASHAHGSWLSTRGGITGARRGDRSGRYVVDRFVGYLRTERYLKPGQAARPRTISVAFAGHAARAREP